MVEINGNEFEQLSDEEVNALWDETFPVTEVPTDLTNENKRAALEDIGFKGFEISQLSDKQVDYVWEKYHASRKVPTDFTIEMKRAVLEIRRHQIAQISDADIDILWKKTVSDIEVTASIKDIRRMILERIQSNPKLLVSAKGLVKSSEALRKHHEDFRRRELLMREWGTLD